jgi:hypothetical protein
VESDVKAELTQLEIDLADEDIYQGQTDRPILSQIRLAFKRRQAARNNCFNLRQAFLERLAEEEAALSGNSTKEKILRSMKHTEAQKGMYKILNQYLKPNQRAGISQIDVPVTSTTGDTTYKTITVKKEMEEALLPHFQQHFRQADSVINFGKGKQILMVSMSTTT